MAHFCAEPLSILSSLWHPEAGDLQQQEILDLVCSQHVSAIRLLPSFQAHIEHLQQTAQDNLAHRLLEDDLFLFEQLPDWIRELRNQMQCVHVGFECFYTLTALLKSRAFKTSRHFLYAEIIRDPAGFCQSDHYGHITKLLRLLQPRILARYLQSIVCVFDAAGRLMERFGSVLSATKSDLDQWMRKQRLGKEPQESDDEDEELIPDAEYKELARSFQQEMIEFFR